MRGGVHRADLCLVPGLPKDLRATPDLADQLRGELPGDIAVGATIVDVPAHKHQFRRWMSRWAAAVRPNLGFREVKDYALWPVRQGERRISR